MKSWKAAVKNETKRTTKLKQTLFNLTKYDVPEDGHLTQKKKKYLALRSPALPGLPPLQINIDRCIQKACFLFSI